MPVAMKERTDHKCLCQQRKKDQITNGCPNQSNPKWLPTCKHKVEKKHTTKSQQSNRLLSATKEWTTTKS